MKLIAGCAIAYTLWLSLENWKKLELLEAVLKDHQEVLEMMQ